MSKERLYIACFWRTDDSKGEFEFESEHRANSRENRNDFLRAYRRCYGSAVNYIELDMISIFLS